MPTVGGKGHRSFRAALWRLCVQLFYYHQFRSLLYGSEKKPSFSPQSYFFPAKNGV